MIQRETRPGSWRGRAVVLAAAFVLLAGPMVPRAALAETIKVGTLRSASSAGPIFIGQEKGYFAAEGLTVEPAFFETAQPIAVAAAGNNIDIGITGLTAAFYSLAGQGALKIVGGYVREVPGFQATAYVASNRAYAAGLTSVKDLPGHSVAVPVLGSPPYYGLVLLSRKYGFDLKSLHIMQLQTNANQVTAVSGGQIDAGAIQASAVLPAIQHGDVKLLSWVGDETPWQLGAIFTTTDIADRRSDMVRRFLRGYGKAVKDFHDAFVGPGETRRDGPTAPAILEIIARNFSLPVDTVRVGLGYVDLKVDVADILRQIAAYKELNLVKGPVDGEALIDRRYVVALPEH